MSDHLAVVGTDTGVGKTVVTAALTKRLRAEGRDARAVKPCQTGHPPDDDAGVVRAACGEASAARCDRYLEPPLAPAVAAEKAGETVRYEELLSASESALAECEHGLVEGIGGLRVPLADDREVIDLVADLDVPALVVTRSGLGTLNHTALTVEALRRRAVPVTGVVVNGYEGATTAERTNPAVLREMTDCPVTTVPAVDGDGAAAVAKTASKKLDPAVLPADLRW